MLLVIKNSSLLRKRKRPLTLKVVFIRLIKCDVYFADILSICLSYIYVEKY